MQYHEFLRMGGFTMKEVPYDTYAKYIEKAYMERDDLFPDKESIISYFKAMGVYGLTAPFLAGIDAVRKAITNLNQQSIGGGFEMLLNLAISTAELPPRLKY